MNDKRYELVGLPLAELQRACEALGIVLPDPLPVYHEITSTLFVAELPEDEE